jgi:hypothetical protein
MNFEVDVPDDFNSLIEKWRSYSNTKSKHYSDNQDNEES